MKQVKCQTFLLLPLVGLLGSEVRAEESALKNTDPSKLRCCIMNEKPFAWTNDKGRAKGIAIENFNALSEHIQDKDGKAIRCASIAQYRNKKNPELSEYEAAIDEMHSCSRNGSTHPSYTNCRCDIIVSMFVSNALECATRSILGVQIFPDRVIVVHLAQATTPQRFERVDILPILFDQFQLVTAIGTVQAQGAAVDVLFILKAFSRTVWLLIFGFMVLTLLVFFSINLAKQTPHGSLRLTAWSAIRDTLDIALSVKNEDGQKVTKEDLNVISVLRFLAGAFCLFSAAFIFSLYSAAVTGRIFELKLKPPLQGIEDFRQCRLQLDQLVVLRNAAEDTYIKSQISNSKCNKDSKQQPHYVNSSEEGFEVLRTEKNNFFFSIQSNVGWDIIH